MNILDENVPKSQRELLQRWRIRVRQIGFDVGHLGMSDEEIIPLLRGLRRPTFFTRDEDFYDRRLCDPRYCLVYVAVQKTEISAFIRRVLRFPALNTQAKRMGTVIRVSRVGLVICHRNSQSHLLLTWD